MVDEDLLQGKTGMIGTDGDFHVSHWLLASSLTTTFLNSCVAPTGLNYLTTFSQRLRAGLNNFAPAPLELRNLKQFYR
jgi:hypothetical protein